MIQADYLVVGGGLFGAYSALYLAGRGYRVVLLEKENDLFRKASIVNQARLHGGYHYPRSIATALMSDDHRERFTAEHRDLVNFSFDQYYAIDKYGSFTDAAQFERFCDHIGIRCEPVKQHPLFRFDRLEGLYLTTEYSFDPFLIAQYYRHRLAGQSKIRVLTGVWPLSVQTSSDGSTWEIETAAGRIRAGGVINATYAASNAVNRLFGCREIDLQHEISEIALIHAPALQHTGLTVMDGPYGSIMPYGKSGLLSVSSVAYTHHKVSYERAPRFDCQASNPACRPDFLADCNPCPARPRSHVYRMMAQMGQYLSEEVKWQYFFSLFTIKSKLQANFIDDGRPTEISQLSENPPFYCIFAGKINSIYEIEKVIQ